MRTTHSLTRPLAATALLALFLAGAAPAARAQKEDRPTLYERLGGIYPIATVVDDFIERLLADDVLNANPKIAEARDRVPKAGLKFQVASLVSQATGGPHKYHGRSMKEAHAHLDITEREWEAMLAGFRKTLDKFNVPRREREELVAILRSTKGDIVTSKGE